MRRNDRKTRRTVLRFPKIRGIICTMKSINPLNKSEVLMTKTVNYTPEMVREMREMAPLNLEKAKILSPLLERSVRSIIAKAKREGIEYVSVKPVAKRVKGKTKTELVESISKKLGGVSLDGLEKAPAIALGSLLECLR